MQTDDPRSRTTAAERAAFTAWMAIVAGGLAAMILIPVLGR